MTAAALIPAIAQPPTIRVTAVRAGEAIRPAQPVQVIQAVRIGTEPGLKLARGPGVMPAGTRMIHRPRLLRLNG